MLYRHDLLMITVLSNSNQVQLIPRIIREDSVTTIIIPFPGYLNYDSLNYVIKITTAPVTTSEPIEPKVIEDAVIITTQKSSLKFKWWDSFIKKAQTS